MATETIGGTLIIQPEFNHLDTLSAREFSGMYEPVASASDLTILDMALVQFVDSTGLGSILSLVRDTLARGARISICGAQPSVSVLFRMVQLAKLVSIFPTRESALAWANA
ncbi:MAG: anti-sigma factor antagonist [Spirochaetales bacterium]|nr:MAG: anti-sigma factor antagonist [Spirochaetales bacterium]